MRPDNNARKPGKYVVYVQEFHQNSSKRFEDIPRPNNKWDIPPQGLKDISPAQILAQPEVQPGTPLRGTLAQKLRERLSILPLTFEYSRLNRCVIIEGEAKEYTLGLFKSVGLECHPRPRKLKDGRTLVELDSPKHVAILLAVPGPLKVERPPGLVTGITESIWSSQDSYILPPDSPSDGECIQDQSGKVLAYISKDRAGQPLYPIQLEQGVIEPSHVLVVANSGQHDVRDMEQQLIHLGAESTKTTGEILPIIYARFPSIEMCASAGLSLEQEPFKGRRVLCSYGNEEAYELEIFG